MTRILSLLTLLLLLLPTAVPLQAQRPLVRYQEFFSGQDLAHSRVSSFYQDSEGFLWMGSWIGLCRYDGQQFTFFRATPGDDNPQSTNRVTKIGETAGGRLWCQTSDKRLYSFDRQRCTFDTISIDSIPARRLAHNSSHRRTWSMTDAYGVQWVMNEHERLCWVDSLTGQLHPVEEALDDRYHGRLPITDYHVYFADQSRNLWVSSGTRLFRLTFGQRQTSLLSLPALGEIRAMRQEADGSILLGDKRGQLCRMHMGQPGLEYMNAQGQWQQQPTTFLPTGIYCLLRDDRQRLWVGTRGAGLYCIDQGRVSRYQHAAQEPYSLPSDDIFDLLQDRQQRIWMATFEGGGLCCIDEREGTPRFLHRHNAWTDYPPQADFARCLAEDARGQILVGTNEGLLIHDPATGRWQLHQHVTSDATSLPSNTVMAVMPRPDATYLLSYGFGISRMVQDDQLGATFHTVANHDFPYGDVCMNAQIDQHDRVWGISESGFTCYSFQPEPSARYFNDYDFGGRYTFGEVQPLLLPTGQMLLGMQGGLFVFDVNRLQKQQHAPRINVTRISYPTLAKTEELYVSGLDSLVLTPDRRSVSIQFSSMDLQASSLMRYAYRLVDPAAPTPPEWTTTQPEVNFINLPAGLFQLEMRSTNADGVWCDNLCRLTILVVPTFWETRWAWLVWLLAVILLATLIGYTVAYIHRLRRQKIELETILERHLQRPEPIAPSPTEPAKPTAPANPHEDFLEAMMNYIEAHIADDNLSVPLLAEEMNMSQATLYRKLKTMVGLSPADFFRKVKMRRAVQYLETTDLPISQVAYSVGFSDPKYFSKCFKHDMGLNPIDYRQKNRQQKS